MLNGKGGTAVRWEKGIGQRAYVARKEEVGLGARRREGEAGGKGWSGSHFKWRESFRGVITESERSKVGSGTE